MNHVLFHLFEEDSDIKIGLFQGYFNLRRGIAEGMVMSLVPLNEDIRYSVYIKVEETITFYTYGFFTRAGLGFNIENNIFIYEETQLHTFLRSTNGNATPSLWPILPILHVELHR